MVLVCDGPGTGPTSCSIAEVMKRYLASAMPMEISVAAFDGSMSSFDYSAALQVLKKRTRGKIRQVSTICSCGDYIINHRALVKAVKRIIDQFVYQ